MPRHSSGARGKSCLTARAAALIGKGYHGHVPFRLVRRQVPDNVDIQVRDGFDPNDLVNPDAWRDEMSKFFRLTLAAVIAAPLALIAVLVNAKSDANIVDTAAAAGKFETLLTAVKAAGLYETLENDGPFTVFAPTDDAFSKLPSGQLDELLRPENRDQLASILKYHVVPGTVMAADLSGKTMTGATLEGETLSIDLAGSAPKIQGAAIVQSDVTAKNGVIHIIDTVLIPE
jgi:uncharacterized surface protein with fasciclin (FAS1) repeats